MPYIYSRNRSYYSDKNQAMLDQVALSVFCDMGIIKQEQYEAVLNDVRAQIDLLQSVKDLEGKQAEEFSERFIEKILDADDRLFYMVPPATLAKAYVGTRERLKNDNLPEGVRDALQEKFNKVATRIDSLINDFAVNSGYYFVDTTNIADVYSGYNEMFDAREPDIEEGSYLRSDISTAREILKRCMAEYDDVNGIESVAETSASAERLEKNFDAAQAKAESYTPSEETIRTASKYKFMDAEGNEIPQFKNGAGELVSDYEEGAVLDSDGRLSAVIDLARHDFVLHHVADEPVSGMVDEEVQSELDKDVLFKLFELDTAEKIVSGAMEDPSRFTDPEQFKQFIQNLDVNGGQISEIGYQTAMDAQVNQTAGFAGRIKQKLGKFASKAQGFFKKVFKPISNIDKRAKDRFEGESPKDRRQRRIDFFVRVLKGLGNGFLISSAVLAVATAGAALSGLSFAVTLAATGILAGVAISAFQIHKWRKAQRAAGKDDSVHALLRDPRMLAMLGTTGIAAIALIFGAAGLTTAAVVMGYGALTVGASSNALFTYKDAKAAGMSTTESVSWALANAAAVVVGGIAGRAVTHLAIDAYNNANPENTLFQNRDVTQEWQKVGEHEETEITYKPETLQHAEEIAKMWYQNNPAELQHRVDLINAYNAEHGTHVDPYRAIVIAGDAGSHTFDNMALHVDGGGHIHSNGQHTVLTAQWAADHNIPMDEVQAIRHMFDDGIISSSEMGAIGKVDAMVSPINEVGVVTKGDAPHYDGVLPQNTTDANGVPVFNTYAQGNSPFNVTTNVVEDFGWVSEANYTPVDVNAMGAFGMYMDKKESKLKDRAGSLADKLDITLPYTPDPIIVDPEPEVVDPVPEIDDPVPVVIEDPVPVIEEPVPVVIEDPVPVIEEPVPVVIEDPVPVIEEPVPVDPTPKPVTEPKWLRITYSQAKDLDDMYHNILTTESQLANPKLRGAKRDKLQSELRKWKDEFFKTRNQVGSPDDDILWSAQYWAYRKKDLEVARARLEQLKRRKITGNTNKYDKADILNEIAELEAKIAEYVAEIPDESLFYDPIPVNHKDKQAKFMKGKKCLEALKQHQQSPSDVIQVQGR